MLIDKEIENLKRFFEGLIPMKELPKALFVVDSRKEDIAVREARDKGIPVIALCGSDCDITLVDYAIPANDASVASIKFFMEKVGQAYEAGKSTIKK
jgi:small subunit ribosomal protein S2